MQGLWLLLLPVAATCGWFTGRSSKSNDRKLKHFKLRKDYFAGLNYVINEQPDKAVDVFIKLLEVDSDTVETHLALGNLFRRKGEVDRAIRIHQNLIARPQLDATHRLHALSALAQDYLKAGMLDRAERLFLELSTSKLYQTQSLRYLMKIYQQEREWVKAIEVAKQLRNSTKDRVNSIIAQYYCELAEKSGTLQKNEEVQTYLKEALSQDDACIRANLIKARMAEQSGDFLEAIKTYQKIEQQNPSFMSETVQPLMRCYQELNNEEAMLEYFKDCLNRYPKIVASLASAQFFEYELSSGTSLEQLAELFVKQPSLAALERLLNVYMSHANDHDQKQYALLHKLVGRLLAHKHLYRCAHCGLSGKMLHWLCPSCQEWGKIVPIALEPE